MKHQVYRYDHNFNHEMETRKSVKNRVLETIMSKFYNDVWKDVRIGMNWPLRSNGDPIIQVRNLIDVGIDFYYTWYTFYRKLLGHDWDRQDFDNRYSRVAAILDTSIQHLINGQFSEYSQYSDVFKLTIWMVTSLKVKDTKDFIDQFSEFIIRTISLNELQFESEKTFKEILESMKEIKAALTIAGALFAIEYSMRKNSDKHKWDRAASFFMEFYKETGYIGVAEAIENEYFGEDKEKLERIRAELSIDSKILNTIKKSIKQLDGVEMVSARVKSLTSIHKKITRKGLDLDDIEGIRHSIKDINGIKIVIDDEKRIGIVIDKIKRILENHQIYIQDIDVECHGYSPDSKIYDWGDKVKVEYKVKHSNYKAIHVNLKLKSNKYVEIQIVLGMQQYYENLYALGVSHIGYKLGNIDRSFRRLTAEMIKTGVFRLKIYDQIVEMQDIEIIDKEDSVKTISKSNSTGKTLIIEIENLQALGLSVLSPKQIINEKELIIEPKDIHMGNNRIVVRI